MRGKFCLQRSALTVVVVVCIALLSIAFAAFSSSTMRVLRTKAAENPVCYRGATPPVGSYASLAICTICTSVAECQGEGATCDLYPVLNTPANKITKSKVCASNGASDVEGTAGTTTDASPTEAAVATIAPTAPATAGHPEGTVCYGQDGIAFPPFCDEGLHCLRGYNPADDTWTGFTCQKKERFQLGYKAFDDSNLLKYIDSKSPTFYFRGAGSKGLVFSPYISNFIHLSFYSCDGIKFNLWEGGQFRCDGIKDMRVSMVGKLFSNWQDYEGYKKQSYALGTGKTYTLAELPKEADYSRTVAITYDVAPTPATSCKTRQECVDKMGEKFDCLFSFREAEGGRDGRCVEAVREAGKIHSSCRDYLNTQCESFYKCVDGKTCEDQAWVRLVAFSPNSEKFEYKKQVSLYSPDLPDSMNIKKVDFHKTAEWGKGKGIFRFGLDTNIVGIPYHEYNYMFQYNCGKPNEKDTIVYLNPFGCFFDRGCWAFKNEVGWVGNNNGTTDQEYRKINCDYSKEKPGEYTLTGRVYLGEALTKEELLKQRPLQLQVKVNLIDP